MDYLDDQEKQAIDRFNKDDVMKEAVRKVLLAGLYENGVLKKKKAASPLYNFALSLANGSNGEFTDEQIAKRLRAQWEGILAVEKGFTELARITLVKEEAGDNKPNPAR